MATKIVTKNSSTASAVPTASDLVQGELAVNVADKRLFTEDNAGAIVELGTNPSALTVTGNVGIGTSSPAEELDISADAPSMQLSSTNASGRNYGLQSTNNGKFSFYDGTAGVDRMVISSDGSVGIGTSSTQAPLHVAGNILCDAFNNGGAGNGLFFRKDFLVTTQPSITLKDHNGSSADGLSINAFDGISFSLNDSEKMRIDSSGNLMVGKTASSYTTDGFEALAAGAIQVSDTSTNPVGVNRNGTDGSLISFFKSGTSVGSIGTNAATMYVSAPQAGGMKYSYLTSTNAVMLPVTTSGANADGLHDLGMSNARFKDLYLSEGISLSADDAGGVGTNTIGFKHTGHTAGYSAAIEASYSGDFRANLLFKINTSQSNTSPVEVGRFDNGGNLLVGTSSTSPGVGNTAVGVAIRGVSDNRSFFSVSSDYVAAFNRNTNDGPIVEFNKNGAGVGSIGTTSSTMWIAGNTTENTGIRFYSVGIAPCNSSGTYQDNSRDLGSSTVRWDDVYATNGTIQTSDRNEKQDIEVLSEAEQRVAVACKGLLRKFRWKDSVAEKGDDARVHFGIIAQDLQDAFAAEGLDAGDYAMFISTTWTDEETNEEKTRMGVRYSELLAFIIAAI